MKFSISSEGKIGISFTVPILAIIVGIFKYPNEIFSYLYNIYDFFSNNMFLTLILGINFILIFFILKILWKLDQLDPKNKKIQRLLNITSKTILIIAGIIFISLSLLSPIFSPKRFARPSIQVIEDNGFASSELVKKIINDVAKEHSISINIDSPSNISDKSALKTLLLESKRKHFDIIIIDCYNPFDFINEEDISIYINPRTLYILLQPFNKDKFPNKQNVVSISPQVIDETLAIASKLLYNNENFQIIRSDDKIGALSEEILRKVIPNSFTRIKSSVITSDFNNKVVKGVEKIVWLDWNKKPEKYINFDLIKEKITVLSVNNTKLNNRNLLKASPLPIVNCDSYVKDNIMLNNQLYTIFKFIYNHFDLGRPMNVDETYNETIKQLRDDNLVLFSENRNIIYRYANLNL